MTSIREKAIHKLARTDMRSPLTLGVEIMHERTNTNECTCQPELFHFVPFYLALPMLLLSRAAAGQRGP
jgi:hypothetical protein